MEGTAGRDSSPEDKSCAEGVSIKGRKAVEHRAGKISKAGQEHEYEGEKKCLKWLSKWERIELSKASALSLWPLGKTQKFSPMLLLASWPVLPEPIQRHALHQQISELRGCPQSHHAGNCQCK